MLPVAQNNDSEVRKTSGATERSEPVPVRIINKPRLLEKEDLSKKDDARRVFVCGVEDGDFDF